MDKAREGGNSDAELGMFLQKENFENVKKYIFFHFEFQKSLEQFQDLNLVEAKTVGVASLGAILIKLLTTVS